MWITQMAKGSHWTSKEWPILQNHHFSEGEGKVCKWKSGLAKCQIEGNRNNAAAQWIKGNQNINPKVLDFILCIADTRKTN